MPECTLRSRRNKESSDPRVEKSPQRAAQVRVYVARTLYSRNACPVSRDGQSIPECAHHLHSLGMEKTIHCPGETVSRVRWERKQMRSLNKEQTQSGIKSVPSRRTKGKKKGSPCADGGPRNTSEQNLEPFPSNRTPISVHDFWKGKRQCSRNA